MTAREASTAKPNWSATCWNISRCWPVATTRQARSSDLCRAAMTGAILMPSGRVPTKTATVLREPMKEIGLRSVRAEREAPTMPEDLGRRQRQVLRVRDQVPLPHLARLHGQAPGPLQARGLYQARGPPHVSGQHVEAAADAHDDGHVEVGPMAL